MRHPIRPVSRPRAGSRRQEGPNAGVMIERVLRGESALDVMGDAIGDPLAGVDPIGPGGGSVGDAVSNNLPSELAAVVDTVTQVRGMVDKDANTPESVTTALDSIVVSVHEVAKALNGEPAAPAEDFDFEELDEEAEDDEDDEEPFGEGRRRIRSRGRSVREGRRRRGSYSIAETRVYQRALRRYLTEIEGSATPPSPILNIGDFGGIHSDLNVKNMLEPAHDLEEPDPLATMDELIRGDRVFATGVGKATVLAVEGAMVAIQDKNGMQYTLDRSNVRLLAEMDDSFKPKPPDPSSPEDIKEDPDEQELIVTYAPDKA